MTIELARYGWDARETRVAIEKFDASLAEYLTDARQSNIKKSFANLTLASNWLGAGLAAAGTLAADVLAKLPTSQAALGAFAAGGACLTLAAGPALLRKRSDAPFAYLVEIDKEFGV
jgi:hypothetical protein